jgi:hypothetical protein
VEIVGITESVGAYRWEWIRNAVNGITTAFAMPIMATGLASVSSGVIMWDKIDVSESPSGTIGSRQRRVYTDRMMTKVSRVVCNSR